MLTNIHPIEEMQALYRATRQHVLTKAVPNKLVESEVNDGWAVVRIHKTCARLAKPKSHDVLLEDRVWCLLYRMGFGHLSGDGGAFLGVDPDDAGGPTNQIDSVAFDNETAVAIECKSAESRRKKPDFDQDIAKHAIIRERFINAVNKQFRSRTKRLAGLAIFTSNVDLTQSDRARAKQNNIVLFNEKDLAYYENLARHLGPAARYQFLSDMLPDRQVPGLTVTLPAIKGKMGGNLYYVFSVSPEFLLKVAFVAHRARGTDPDNTYQRMVAGPRLKAIRQYISEKGIFPTNIVVNIEKPKASVVQFDQAEQGGDEGNGVMGWLRLKPGYGFAWIIDGQHRLYAFSGHPLASTSLVSVLAFQGLPHKEQANLFVKINAEQKSVKKSHLQELYSILRWDAVDPAHRADAIIARSVAALDADADSPFFNRIQRADDQKSGQRCITWRAVSDALCKPGLYISKQKEDGSVIAYGPLWGGNNAEASVTRTVRALNAWFGAIRMKVPDWWDLGKDAGGGLAMNDSVTASIDVLRSVFQHLEDQGTVAVKLDDDELTAAITPYAEILGEFFGGFSPEQRGEWRGFLGSGGHATRARRCQEAIQKRVPDFAPEGLREFLETMQAKTNTQAREIIDRMEMTLQRVVLQGLNEKFSSPGSDWWVQGVPKAIRMKATQRQEDDDNQRGRREYYLDLIDYRDIVLNNWLLFQDLLGLGKPNQSKQKRTQWIVDLNERRKIVMHASSGRYVTLDELAEVRSYDEWLAAQVNGSPDLLPAN